MYPDDRHYTREHEWVRKDDGVALIGITDHAQNELGDLVFVELPAPGQKVEAGQPMGTVESVKAVSEIFAPVSGEITEVNETLADQPELLNKDPHGDGWLVRVKVDGAAGEEDLMTAAEYGSFVEKGD